ncbi:phosphatase PAP2 family protein [Caenibius sp. WL]|nr:phosphatase PAP2 family protein [Caenibius sp. WL]
MFIAALLCWGGFALVALLTFTGHMAGFDKAGLLLWREADGLIPASPPWLNTGVIALTHLGGVPVRNAIALAAAITLVLAHSRRQALCLSLTVIGGWIANSALKTLFDRPRPTIVPHLTYAGGPSFPSGHSFNAGLIYIAMALIAAGWATRRPARVMLVSAAIMLSLAIAGSRVWLGVHYPSDVIAGWLGGAGLAFLMAAWFLPEAPPRGR